MPLRKIKASGEIDYKLACRCCLKSDAEFYKLDSVMVARNIGYDESNAFGSDGSEKIPLLRCLLFCIRTENVPELPQYICLGCSKSLQIAYHFLQNALRAHEILCNKLCPDKSKGQRAVRLNGQQNHIIGNNSSEKERTLQKQQQQQLEDCGNDEGASKPRKTVRHECKVCGAVIYNRLELKQHIRLHSDVVAHSCTMCSFVTLKQYQLIQHYKSFHNLTAAQCERKLKSSIISTSSTGSTQPTPSKNGKSEQPAIRSANSSIGEENSVVCTLEDMEMLIPTVLRPEDYETPHIDAEHLQELEKQLTESIETAGATATVLDESLATLELPRSINNTTTSSNAQNICEGSSNLTIGTEFLVMPDGSLQQINGNGVVIEYINATDGDVKNNRDEDLITAADNSVVPMDIDVNELIVEEVQPNSKRTRGTPRATVRYKCQQCPKTFATAARLKCHQLTHSNLPKFYCDQCAFYSLRSSELMQHHKEMHNIDSTSVLNDGQNASVPTDESKIYSCDMCLFETKSPGQLRLHYNKKHRTTASDVELRPSWCVDNSSTAGTSTQTDANSGKQQQVPEIPLGIQYPRPTNAAANMASSEQLVAAVATSMENAVQFTTDSTLLCNSSSSAQADVANLPPVLISAATNPSTILPVVDSENNFSIFPQISANMASSAEQIVTLPTTTGNVAVSIIGDMQDFIDDTDVAAICTIPADGLPVVDGDDIVIDNNNINLDFDAENLFEDFEDDEEDGEAEEEEEEDDADNDDENDNNDAAIDQNLLLTSDDDDVDDFDDEQSRHLQKPYCIFCNKKFTSQYKFENHMFLHRGLAPYRCELCTNIYNKKRALIRHYKAVHKRMPTRDMVQAKGDKISLNRTNIEKLHMDKAKAPVLMCAKCPFECELETDMPKHLNAHHGINDGVTCHAKEVFIIRKLPFECPRCIRSFAAKGTLTRHLQRSHLVDTIIELQSPPMTTSSATTSSATTTTTSTPTTALPNANEIASNKAVPEQLVAGECARTGVLAKPPQRYQYKFHDTTETTTMTTSAELTTSLHISTNSNEPTMTPLPTNTASTLFPSPTFHSFDFDYYDLMDETHAAVQHLVKREPEDHNSYTDALTKSTNYSHVLRDDKLLPTALLCQDTSPVKDLRSYLPRTPIFVCRQCNYTCDELSKLNQHQAMEHANNGDTTLPRRNYDYKCSICNSTYRTISLLQYHMKRHAKRNYKCDLCPKTFVVRPELTKHRVTHSKETPFKCNVEGCQKAFNYKHHLKRHYMSTHLRKRYTCTMPECGKELASSSQLAQHMHFHKGTHAYKCPRCTRAYTRRKPLRLHAMREHQLQLSEDDLADIYRANVGYTNPHDLRVFTGNGELLRRSAVEAAAANKQRAELEEAVVNISI